MYNFGVVFGVFRHFIPEQIAAAKVKKNRRNLREILARATGLEPVTYGLTVRCSTD